MRYTIAHKVWKFGTLVWIGLLIAILINYTANVAPTPMKDFATNFSTSVLGWFFLPGLNRILTFSALSLLIVIPVSAWFITTREQRSKYDGASQRYLDAVIEANKGLNPRGFSQSQALISVNVPLNDIFIHLYAVPDRPVYDVPSEQQKLLEELRQRADLSLAEREELIQRLRVVWYSQLGQGYIVPSNRLGNVPPLPAEEPPRIDQVVAQLTIERPVAILLGAPGSGKTTAMRWLALQMAHASISPRTLQPYQLYPDQIPIFLRVSDYAKRLSVESISLEEHLKDHFARLYRDLPELTAALLNKLRQGCCLVLFDGLDEVASDSLRRSVTENIHKFISDYAPQKPMGQLYNRFIITSRIVGYEPGAFAHYPHYTLLELEDQQIKQFLTNWCPAVERYQIMCAQGMKPLTLQQEKHATARGIEQQNRLLEAIQNSGIKRLAINPLMLTILALIQRGGRTLPHQRIELYQIVTRTLLDNWNKDSERRVFLIEEVPLAEQLLGNLAYHLHNSDPLLTEQDVRSITRQTMADFYQHSADQIKESGIQEFIETLRRSSGLFVESGQGLFSFMHRTFQEYFVALHLLRKTPEDLKQFVLDHYRLAIWREPLLLAIAYKSEQNSRDERYEASELIRILAHANDKRDLFLHYSLLFAASSIVDCRVWSIDKEVQYYIANALFDLYGDPFDTGRYASLQEEIERVALLWLRGQPQSSQQTSLPPLLDAWRNALCDADNALRQEGAVRLLSSIAPSIDKCPSIVLNSIVPPLIQISDLLDLPYPSELSMYFPKKPAHPSNPIVENYAFIALRLLDAAGPAGWLHNAWLKWNEEQPELLGFLAQHMNELNHLITPASFPNKSDPSNRRAQHTIVYAWEEDNEYNTHRLQLQLLDASNSARFPHAYLLKQMLDREQKLSTSRTGWRLVWDSFLRAEMARGRSATYLPCLCLLLLLWQEDRYKLQEIADELVKALSIKNKTQTQALLAISYVFLHSFQKDVNIQLFNHILQLIDVRLSLEALDTLDKIPDTRPRPGLPPRPLPRGYRKLKLVLGYNIHAILVAPTLKIKINREENAFDHDRAWFGNPLIPSMSLRELRDIRDLGKRTNLQRWIEQPTSLQILTSLGAFIDYEELTSSLCSLLEQSLLIHLMSLILALCVMVYHRPISKPTQRKLLNTIQVLKGGYASLGQEHRLLIEVADQLLQDPVDLHQTPLARETALRILEQQTRLTESEVRMLLSACCDARLIFDDNSSVYRRRDTVQEVAWEVLSQQFDLDLEALPIIFDALLHKEAIVCAAAALLLQHSKALPPDRRTEAIQKITTVLIDDQLSRRPLEPPDRSKIWRLSDVLFEALQALEENSK